MSRHIVCDYCGEQEMLGGTKQLWVDGTRRHRNTIGSYYEVRKVRISREAAPFKTLHYCSLPCLQQGVASLGSLGDSARATQEVEQNVWLHP